MYRDQDIDRSRPLALNGPHEDGGLDLTHAVLGALLLATLSNGLSIVGVGSYG